jgi:hypothetical protein
MNKKHENKNSVSLKSLKPMFLHPISQEFFSDEKKPVANKEVSFTKIEMK